MRDGKELVDRMNNVEKSIEEIRLLEKTLKENLIEVIKNQMDWARFRYDEGGADYAERIEFADFYFKLNDILEELYRYEVGGIVSLNLDVSRAYSDLRSSVQL